MDRILPDSATQPMVAVVAAQGKVERMEKPEMQVALEEVHHIPIMHLPD